MVMVRTGVSSRGRGGRLLASPAFLVQDLLLGEPLGLDAQRGELGARDEVVYLDGDGLDARRHARGVLYQVVRRERLHGEGEVHDLHGMTVRRRDVDEPAPRQYVQPPPVGE